MSSGASHISFVDVVGRGKIRAKMDVQQIRRLPTTVFRPRFGFLEVMGKDIQFSEGMRITAQSDTEKVQFVRDVM
jgi:hypothetical protein